MVLSNDEAALLGEEVVDSKKSLSSGEKRTTLFRDDHVAVMQLQPYGLSAVQNASLADLWGFAKRGGNRTILCGVASLSRAWRRS